MHILQQRTPPLVFFLAPVQTINRQSGRPFWNIRGRPLSPLAPASHHSAGHYIQNLVWVFFGWVVLYLRQWGKANHGGVKFTVPVAPRKIRLVKRKSTPHASMIGLPAKPPPLRFHLASDASPVTQLWFSCRSGGAVISNDSHNSHFS